MIRPKSSEFELSSVRLKKKRIEKLFEDQPRFGHSVFPNSFWPADSLQPGSYFRALTLL